MKLQNNKLVIRQLDKKMKGLRPLLELPVPSGGWINLIRKTLNMSLNQLGSRLSMTPQGVKYLEKSEGERTITLRTLRDTAEALDMKVVYYLIPKDGSLENMIERKAHDMATKIVKRTSTTMKLEDQENSEERIKQAIEELTEELKREMPKNLWD